MTPEQNEIFQFLTLQDNRKGSSESGNNDRITEDGQTRTTEDNETRIIQ